MFIPLPFCSWKWQLEIVTLRFRRLVNFQRKAYGKRRHNLRRKISWDNFGLVSQNMPGIMIDKFKVSIASFAPQIESFCICRTLYLAQWFSQLFFYHEFTVLPLLGTPVINLMYLLKYVPTYEKNPDKSVSVFMRLLVFLRRNQTLGLFPGNSKAWSV